MSVSKDSPRYLPEKPREEYLRKEAKRFARRGGLQLAAAQRQLAHEYGYRNWAELIAVVRAMSQAGGGGSSGRGPSSTPSDASARSDADRVLPLLPLRELVAFPNRVYPIFVARPKSIRALILAGERKLPIVLLAQKDPAVEDPSDAQMYEIGTLGTLASVLPLPDGTRRLAVQANKRVRAARLVFDESLYKAQIEEIEEPPVSGAGVNSLINSVISAAMRRRILTSPDWSIAGASADWSVSESAIADGIASRLCG